MFYIKIIYINFLFIVVVICCTNKSYEKIINDNKNKDNTDIICSKNMYSGLNFFRKKNDNCKTVFITGTNSGIGKELVLEFASNGWNVAATVRKKQYLEVFSKIKNVKTYLLDVTKKENIKKVSAEVIQDFKKVDVIINNAGYIEIGPVETTSMNNYENLYNVNVFGLINICKAFIPHLRKNKSGSIINISSDMQGFGYFSNYASSKQAVVGFSESLRCEMEKFNVDVKVIFPGIHNSKLFQKEEVVVGRTLKEYKYYKKNLINFNKIFGSFKARSIKNAAKDLFRIANKKSGKYKYYLGYDIKMLIFLRNILGEELFFKILSRTIKGQNIVSKIISIFNQDKYKRFSI